MPKKEITQHVVDFIYLELKKSDCEGVELKLSKKDKGFEIGGFINLTPCSRDDLPTISVLEGKISIEEIYTNESHYTKLKNFADSLTTYLRKKRYEGQISTSFKQK